ncbi:serine aminopeptidase domain-containing protein [Allonocardiopsis opalescens]|uniref:Poly(ethylene terephthalate) hydrolase n=1 Tax=Allonocardiopsis opalescens TaxID=1144618 RepID=A0A2T0PXG2_9ACTN|nr:alpha/beta hydrolase [Allonocardiopsis opalescens]PRX96086.1 cutinase [Allonocardiopsis opalescens]
MRSPLRTSAAPPSPRRTRRAGRLLLTLALVAAGLAAAGPAQADENPYERGPNPTESSVEAVRGPFATASTSVSSLVAGFGGGTIHYPTSTAEGTFGAVALAPGYTASSTSYSWFGPRLASQGFVVFLIDTDSRFDQPGSRGDQLLNALDYLVEDSSVRNRIDPDRLAVMGHSMGGGGSLSAAEERPELQAAIPMTPWHISEDWSDVSVPTLIIGAEDDTVASVGSHAIPFYESLPGSLDRAYMELADASHFVPNSADTNIARYTISWLKRFVDNDTRYEQFLCPPPDTGLFSDFSDYRDSCPHSG